MQFSNGRKIPTLLLAGVIALIPIATPAQAFFGGGISGPLPVYNVNSTVDAATLATQINTLQQLQAALQNLASMDEATAAANLQQIQLAMQQLNEIQNSLRGTTYDFQNFQQQWDSQYQDFGSYAGQNAAQYGEQARQLMLQTDAAVYNAARAQGLVNAQLPGEYQNLQYLLNASQSAQGALSAAQAGNQIAALQIQQMMRLQQIVAASNEAQAAYQAEQIRREVQAQEFTKHFLRKGADTAPETGPGIIGG